MTTMQGLGVNQLLSNGFRISLFDSTRHVVHTVLRDGELAFKGSLVALNPETLLSLQKNEGLQRLLKSDPICYVDGIGLSMLIKMRLGITVKRVPGCEIWEDLMIEAGKWPLKVYLIGGEPGVAASVAKKISTEFNVDVCGYRDGFFDAASEEEVLATIVAGNPDIVCVAMGTPRQEAFMYKCGQLLPNKLLIGVGGTFDVHSGKVRRAPLLFRRLNLEWLFRTCLQPRLRLPRLFRMLGAARQLLSSDFKLI